MDGQLAPRQIKQSRFIISCHTDHRGGGMGWDKKNPRRRLCATESMPSTVKRQGRRRRRSWLVIATNVLCQLSLALTRIKAGVLLPRLDEPPFCFRTSPESSTLSSYWSARGTHCSRCHTGRNIQKTKFHHLRLLVGAVVFCTTWSFLMLIIRHDAGYLSATAKRRDYRPESTKSDQDRVYSATSPS